MNLSESMRHYAQLLENTADQYVLKGIQNWDKRAGTQDVPPKDPNDGLNPRQPPTEDWSAAKTERWLVQYGDTRLINKRSRHQPIGGASLPALSVMIRTRNWHDFVRYYAILKFAYFQAQRNNDSAAAAELKVRFNPLHTEFKRRREEIRDQEYQRYDMKGKMQSDHPDMFVDPAAGDGGLEW